MSSFIIMLRTRVVYNILRFFLCDVLGATHKLKKEFVSILRLLRQGVLKHPQALSKELYSVLRLLVRSFIASSGSQLGVLERP
jgi:hypothetical protein